ncbi:unnamed protein product [Rotaria socialis]|uniref:Uncharacterized protein n=2 Tax=Rotaria socialis TaxID=392032 RepID=A0A818AUW4_9BILA|nr:unnamed protein product [Rotaria socialis]CAF3462761.1 unnamed protein product [Rotaria socialis]CAF3463121.1 unnamed protein product [Rotaria socialis]CAF3667677.1 unnamed protein product [Rotaria socialis]CAF3697038.1 unnamed protein product [Rotaria socialis]
MINFVHVDNKGFKMIKSVRRRFLDHRYAWRQHKNIRHMIILIKMIYAIIFICFTISSCLSQSVAIENKELKSIFTRIWDIWYSFLALMLLLSLLVDRLKTQNILSSNLINIIHIFIVVIFIIFVILGHIQGLYRLWWLSSSPNQLECTTFLSVVFIDICPIMVAFMITFNLFKKRRSWRYIHVSTFTSNV